MSVESYRQTSMPLPDGGTDGTDSFWQPPLPGMEYPYPNPMRSAKETTKTTLDIANNKKENKGGEQWLISFNNQKTR